MPRFPSLGEFGEYAVGAVGSFLFNHFSRYIPPPTNQAYVVRDAQGRYIWGFSTNNALTLAVGALAFLGGKWKRITAVKNVGKGWLLYFGMEKFLVEPMQYTYVTNPPRYIGQAPFTTDMDFPITNVIYHAPPNIVSENRLPWLRDQTY